MALTIFEEGGPGLGWWSTIEASWPNVTLFSERVINRLALAAEPEPITVDHPVVMAVAEALGIQLGR
jgi:hypothetical protein